MNLEVTNCDLKKGWELIENSRIFRAIIKNT
jgi:hypothetical protein